MENLHTYTGGQRFRGIVMVVLIMAIVALGAYAYATIKGAKYSGIGPATISVTGDGEVLARPDIAAFSFSVIAEGDDASTAQDQSAEAVNTILAYLEEQGIEEKDIKTLYYNLNPRYEYLESICNNRGYCPPGERILRGYEVNQTIEVKVRNVENAGDFLSGVGSRGATNVSGLSFTIDDEDTLYAQAREAAIADARVRAEELANDLGVRLVRVVGFWENGMDKGGYTTMNRMEAYSDDAAVGQMAAPSVPTGENTFMSQVTINYEIR